MAIPLPHADIQKILLPIYAPCPGFGTCAEAVWNPALGHVPRGFLGACGALEEVRAIMVFAEPGGVYPTDHYDPRLTAKDLLAASVAETGRIIATSQDQFHRNIRWFLDQLLPGQDFVTQLRGVWMTEGRLCSVVQEIGGRKDRSCADRYLARQIALMPKAVVIGFGGKAQVYLSALRIPHCPAYALAPPGANHRPARPSWNAALAEVRRGHSA
ncbi:MAG: hypothetical protein GW948_00925 [Rhodobacterales bacterium]|nr:hypothetical protein [Rhodobacterales bacterium]